MRTALLPAFAALLLAAGCTSSVYVSPVEVTRFVGQSPAELGVGQINLRLAPGQSAAPDLEPWLDAVSAQLEMLGYDVVATGGAQTAQVSIEQWEIDPDAGRSPVSVGGGASVGSYGSGVGLGIGLDLTPREAKRIETQLSVSIRSAQDGPNLWEGRASMTASINSEFGDESAAAQRMAASLFEGFPGQTAETVVVE